MDFGSLYFSFYGRINRLQMLVAGIIQLIVVVMLALIFSKALGGLGNDDASGAAGGISTAVFIFAIVVAMIVSGAALMVKRLHDLGLSGWVHLGMVVASFIPIVGVVVLIAQFFICFIIPGQPGDNAYGSPPSGLGGGKRTSDTGGHRAADDFSSTDALDDKKLDSLIAEALARRNASAAANAVKPKSARANAGATQVVAGFGRRGGSHIVSGKPAFGRR